MGIDMSGKSALRARESVERCYDVSNVARKMSVRVFQVFPGLPFATDEWISAPDIAAQLAAHSLQRLRSTTWRHEPDSQDHDYEKRCVNQGQSLFTHIVKKNALEPVLDKRF